MIFEINNKDHCIDIFNIIDKFTERMDKTYLSRLFAYVEFKYCGDYSHEGYKDMLAGISRYLNPEEEVYPSCIGKTFIIKKKQGAGVALVAHSLNAGLEKLNAEGYLSNYKAVSKSPEQ